MDDFEKIRAIANGNRKVFQEFYEQFSERVYNTALSYSKSVPFAEEITQDVFTKIYINASKFKGNASVSTWVYRITVNASLDHVQKEKRSNQVKFESPQSEQIEFNHPGVLFENKENAAALFKVMEGLKDTQKMAFTLSYIEDLPRQEVADIMEVSLKAVESLLQRAKQNMRQKLNKLYPNRRKSKK